MRREIEKLLVDSGLWAGERRESHHFQATQSVYEMTPKQARSLNLLGPAIHDVMSGLGRIITIAADPKLASGPTWQSVRDLSRKQVPKIFHDLQALRPEHSPAIVKVDFMEDGAGQYWVAELDTTNRRALGYATVLADVREMSFPGTAALPGAALLLARELKQRRVDTLFYLYANIERFYRPEFEILRDRLAALGVRLVLAGEMELEVDGDKVSFEGEEVTRLAIDFPSNYKRPEVTEALAGKYRRRELNFLIPPKPALGSKVLLALLRNDSVDPVLEGILRSQIPADSLNLVRSVIPTTYLVGKLTALPQGEWVLKEVVSSGMKGVWFSDEPDFQKAFDFARTSSGRFILQERVVSRRVSFPYYNGDGTNALHHEERAMRLIVHFIGRAPADCVVTATASQRVHGGKEAVLCSHRIKE